MTPPKKKKSDFPPFWAGVLAGAAWLTFFSFVSIFSQHDERVDNYVPFGVDCVDGKDVFIYGHKKPTFMCTKYVRNSIPLRSR